MERFLSVSRALAGMLVLVSALLLASVFYLEDVHGLASNMEVEVLKDEGSGIAYMKVTNNGSVVEKFELEYSLIDEYNVVLGTRLFIIDVNMEQGETKYYRFPVFITGVESGKYNFRVSSADSESVFEGFNYDADSGQRFVDSRKELGSDPVKLDEETQLDKLAALEKLTEPNTDTEIISSDSGGDKYVISKVFWMGTTGVSTLMIILLLVLLVRSRRSTSTRN